MAIRGDFCINRIVAHRREGARQGVRSDLVIQRVQSLPRECKRLQNGSLWLVTVADTGQIVQGIAQFIHKRMGAQPFSRYFQYFAIIG